MAVTSDGKLNRPAMRAFLDSLAQRGPAFPLVLAIALALLAAGVAVLSLLHARNERRWAGLLRGADGASLEALLHEHAAERHRLQAEVESLSARVKHLEEKGKSAKRHVGLVRFDAFEDVGGSQSFALAVLDDRGDGAVLSSIVGRQTCRVFAKALVGGRSERELSGEEQRAIREAVAAGPRAAVTV
jgi:hypothetical protein